MKVDKSALAQKYFHSDTTSRDRAMFELGIKLGALFHQFIGTPIKNEKKQINLLARGIEAAIGSQPYVSHVQVQLIPKQSVEKPDLTEYDYIAISEKNLIATIELVYEMWKITGKIEWIDDLNYPLMFIHDIVKQ